MTSRVSAVLVFLMAAYSAPACAQSAAPNPVERGKAVFKEQQCQACHSVAGAGNRRYPLDAVGSTLSEDAIRKWIVAPREMNPTVRKRAYDKLSKPDLDALVAYLKTLRGK